MMNDATQRRAAPILLAAWLLASSASAEAPADVASPPADAERSASGLAWKVLAPGTGDVHPDANDRVRVNYTGWTPQGGEIANEMADFHLQEVFAGWSEAIQLMVVGEKRRFWIPEHIGARSPQGDPRGDAVFDVELLAIDPVPNLPAELRKPPPGAERTLSGAFTRKVEAGTGDERPQSESVVLLSYTGWTTDGKTFDSTALRGRPTAFPLAKMMAPFAEAVQMMVVGEKRQLWIPGELAAGNWVGSPQGSLIFEIELLQILPSDVLGLPVRESG